MRPHHQHFLSYATSLFVVISLLFTGYEGVLWISTIFPLFFVWAGMVMFGGSLLFMLGVFGLKLRAMYHIDTQGLKPSAIARKKT